VNVTDQTAPVVSLIGSPVENIYSGSVYTDFGATYIDNVDGTGNILLATSGSVNNFLTGTYILEYTYTDGAGNSGTAIRTVNVLDPDLTTPIVTLNGS